MSNAPSIEAIMDDSRKNSNQEKENPNNNNGTNQLVGDESSEEAKQNIFADGILEEYIEETITPKEWTHQGSVIHSTKIERKRKNLYKVVITKKKKEFGAQVMFYDKEPGVEGNYEVKPPPKTHDYLSMPRNILEIGFQTKHSIEKPIQKSFQVHKTRKVNASTQVFDNNEDLKPIFNTIVNDYFKTSKYDHHSQKNNIHKIETFIDMVRPRIEEALQSNETIDIFQSDFHLDKFDIGDKTETVDKKKQDSEMRTFRDNMLAGQKSKKEKCINYVNIVEKDSDYIAHTFLRNLTFEERIKTVGVPYNGYIVFWNFRDPEINSPVYILELPMEITMFEFNPLNPNSLVCGLFSGQIIFLEFKDLMHILHNGFDNEFTENLNKTNKSDIYTFYITSIQESHKTHLTGMKWFPAGYSFHKHQLQYNESSKDIMLLTTCAEDGQVLIWDTKHLDSTVKNEVNNYIKPVLRVDINKMDSLLKICCSSLQLKIKLNEPLMYVGTDDGQVYTVDWREKVTQDNTTNNIKKVFNPCYFRPVIAMEFSPFYEDIFMTVHDFYFCIWNKNYSHKPIIMSPNLKTCFYVGGKFSLSRPAVVMLARNNGQIDMWDFLDESHKPSVKETFLKEVVTFIDLFMYSPTVEDEGVKKIKVKQEYLVLGDQSGQLTLMQIPKLFTDKVNDEVKLVQNIFENEIKRQKYMDMRYKELEDEINKPLDEVDVLITGVVAKPKTELPEEAKEESEMRNAEEEYLKERQRIMEEYGFDDTTNIEENEYDEE